MLNDFQCPACKGQLRVGEQIIFMTKSKNRQGGLILLHPEPGNYIVENHPSFKLEEGEHVDFYCPICHSKLTSEKHKNLAMAIMIDDSGKEFEVYFSKIAGEKCTYQVIGNSVEIYGKHAKTYLDFFNLSQTT